MSCKVWFIWAFCAFGGQLATYLSDDYRLLFPVVVIGCVLSGHFWKDAAVCMTQNVYYATDSSRLIEREPIAAKEENQESKTREE